MSGQVLVQSYKPECQQIDGSDLPDDIITSILANLSSCLDYRAPFPTLHRRTDERRALRSASTVSKQWRSLALPLLQRHLDLSLLDETGLKRMLDTESDQAGKAVKALRCSLYLHHRGTDVTLLETLPLRYPNLIWLEISLEKSRVSEHTTSQENPDLSAAVDMLQNAIGQLQFLEYLSFGGHPQLPPVYGRTSWGAVVPKSWLLPTAFAGSLCLRSRCKLDLPVQLSSLVLYDIDTNGVETMFKRVTLLNLRELCIQNLFNHPSRQIRPALLKTIAEQAPKLRELWIGSSSPAQTLAPFAEFRHLARLACGLRPLASSSAPLLPTHLRHLHILSTIQCTLRYLISTDLSSLEALAIYDDLEWRAHVTKGERQALDSFPDQLRRTCRRNNVRLWHRLVARDLRWEMSEKVRNELHSYDSTTAYDTFQRGALPE